MLFNSIEFAIFLPIVFLLYWFVFNRNLKLQNLFIVVVSYIFYGWWDWRFLFLIAFTSACSFGAGLLIEKYRGTPAKAKAVIVVNIVINSFSAIFKNYVDNPNAVIPTSESVIKDSMIRPMNHIREVFLRHGTDYRIAVTPGYCY